MAGLKNNAEARLGNPLSDDSLFLDEALSLMWADCDHEPAKLSELGSLASQSNCSKVANCDEELRNERNPWLARDQEEFARDASNNPALNRSTNGIFNVSVQTRLSFSAEDAESPLLGDHLQEDVPDVAGHCHFHVSNQSNDTAWKRLLLTTLMCIFFMIAEVVGSHYAGSLATLTDAAHLMSDLVGLLVSLSAVWLGSKPPTKVLSFGFHRAEVLGALFSIFVIWVLTGVFVYLAALRVWHGNFNINADRMMAVAAGAILINIVMALVLHGGCQHFNVPHSHSLGHHQHLHEASNSCDDENQRFSFTSSNSHTHDTGLQRRSSELPNKSNQLFSTKKTNINVRAAAIHVLGDLLQSIGVFVSAVVIKFNPNAKMADPICTFLFAIIVLATTIPLLRDTGLILLEGFPPNLQYNQVLSVLRAVPGVHHVHSLHVWSLTIGKHALAVHLAVDPSADRDAVTCTAHSVLQRKFGILHCTIQTELYNPAAMHTCLQCQPLVS